MAVAAQKSIHLIAGSDEFTIKQTAAKLAETLAPKDAGAFGVEVIEGAAANADEALTVLGRLNEALQTVGFFGAEKLVWLKSTNLLADDRAVAAEAVKDALAEFAEQLKRGVPSGVTLLISAIGFDKRRSLAKTLEKMAAVQTFDAPEAGKRAGEEEIGEAVRRKLQAEGKRLSQTGYQVFRELVAPEMREIANELEKLCLYVGKRADITDADVRTICSASRESKIWDLTDTVGARNLREAFAILDNLLGSGEEPIGIVMMLVGQFRLTLLMQDLLQRRVITAQDGGWQASNDFKARFESLPPEHVAHFPRTKEGKPPSAFRAYRCALAAKNFTSDELVRAMELLLEANRLLVSTQLDDRLVLEETLAKIVRQPAAVVARN